MWITRSVLGFPAKDTPIIAKIRGKFKHFARKFKRAGEFSLGKRLWTGGGKRRSFRGERGKKEEENVSPPQTGRKEIKSGLSPSFLGMGKKVFPIFPARVEKIGKVWYNHRMNTKTPDLAACKALIEQNAPRFRLFFDILTAYNARFNLTAITKEEEVFHKHFLDSVAGAFLLPAGAAVTEVGAGAGFPSLPLKLVRDDLTFTLIESTGKKCDFLREACRALGLTGMEVRHTRAEDAARTALPHPPE